MGIVSKTVGQRPLQTKSWTIRGRNILTTQHFLPQLSPVKSRTGPSAEDWFQWGCQMCWDILGRRCSFLFELSSFHGEHQRALRWQQCSLEITSGPFFMRCSKKSEPKSLQTVFSVQHTELGCWDCSVQEEQNCYNPENKSLWTFPCPGLCLSLWINTEMDQTAALQESGVLN